MRGDSTGPLMGQLCHQCNRIEANGNKACDWLEFFLALDEMKTGRGKTSERDVFISNKFCSAFQNINKTEKQTEAYAHLLLTYAFFVKRSSESHARDLLREACGECAQFSFVHITAAQFEVDLGKRDKARKILEKASKESRLKSKDLIFTAFSNLSYGKQHLVPPQEDSVVMRSTARAESSHQQPMSCNPASTQQAVRENQVLSEIQPNNKAVQPQMAAISVIPGSPNKLADGPSNSKAGHTLTAEQLLSRLSHKASTTDESQEFSEPENELEAPPIELARSSETSRPDRPTMRHYHSTPDCKNASNMSEELPRGSTVRRRNLGPPIRVPREILLIREGTSVEPPESGEAMNQNSDKDRQRPPDLGCNGSSFNFQWRNTSLLTVAEEKDTEGCGSSLETKSETVKNKSCKVLNFANSDVKQVIQRNGLNKDDNNSGIGAKCGHEDGGGSDSRVKSSNSVNQDNKRNDLKIPELMSPNRKLKKNGVLPVTTTNPRAVNEVRSARTSNSSTTLTTSTRCELPVFDEVSHEMVNPNAPVESSVRPTQDPLQQKQRPLRPAADKENQPPDKHRNQAVVSQAVFKPIQPYKSKQQLSQAPAAAQQPPIHILPFPDTRHRQSLTIKGQSYELIRLLGKGGFSKVYKCLTTSCQEVAVKCVHVENVDIQSYLNEIQLLQKLQGSPRVIRLMDYDLQPNCLYMVMEVGERDLANFLEERLKSGPLCQYLRHYYWEEMLKCVQVIHNEGVIHSDLKPANFVHVSASLKLIDFGIAKSVPTDHTSITTDQQMGTLNYMSPEALMDLGDSQKTDERGRHLPRLKIGVKSDVWSLGCILYYMLYARMPFSFIPNQFAKLRAITDPTVAIPFPEHPDIELAEIAKKCLQRDPRQRPCIDELLAMRTCKCV